MLLKMLREWSQKLVTTWPHLNYATPVGSPCELGPPLVAHHIDVPQRAVISTLQTTTSSNHLVVVHSVKQQGAIRYTSSSAKTMEVAVCLIF